MDNSGKIEKLERSLLPRTLITKSLVIAVLIGFGLSVLLTWLSGSGWTTLIFYGLSGSCALFFLIWSILNYSIRLQLAKLKSEKPIGFLLYPDVKSLLLLNVGVLIYLAVICASSYLASSVWKLDTHTDPSAKGLRPIMEPR